MIRKQLEHGPRDARVALRLGDEQVERPPVLRVRVRRQHVDVADELAAFRGDRGARDAAAGLGHRSHFRGTDFSCTSGPSSTVAQPTASSTSRMYGPRYELIAGNVAWTRAPSMIQIVSVAVL